MPHHLTHLVLQPLDTSAAAASSSSVSFSSSAWSTPKFVHHRRIQHHHHADADDNHAAKLDAYQSYNQNSHHQNAYPTPEIALRRSVHDLPRPPFQAPLLLPPLAVSSISPAHSARPLVSLAPLRRYAAKPVDLHHDQQDQHHDQHHDQHQDQHQHQYQHQPQQQVPIFRPTLSLPPAPRHELSILSLLSSPHRARSPRQRSPYAADHHHHPYSHHFQRTPVLPALRSVGLPIDDGSNNALSPVNSSSAAPSPASSTSSYSSFGVDSCETVAATSTSTPRVSSSRAAASSSTRPAAKCRREHCLNAARRKGLCMEHGGRHFCKMEGCSKCAHRGGFCISHGGGRRCAVANCTKSAQSGGICYSHGGGKRCATDGCSHAARSGGFCIKHGKQQSSVQQALDLEEQ